MISSWEMALYKVELLTQKKKKKKQFENPVIISTFLLLRKFLEVSRCHHKFICIEAFLPELPHSETKEEGENFCNEISPKTWQQ